MEEEAPKSFREYLGVLRRRKELIVVTAAVLAAVSIALAVTLPAVYRSSATILVQEQEIPPDLVRSTITSFADERIQVISQQIMTRAVLLDLIDKHSLYERRRKRETTEQLVDRMHKDIKLSTVNADVSDRSSGRRVNATIAFKISYDAPKPEQAQGVVDDLVALYLSENAKARQRSAAETTAFISEEADRLAKQIQDTETRLADFKRRYTGRLPESAAVNQQLVERTESDLLRIERESSMLQDRKIYLESQLSLVKPNAPLAPVAGGERVPLSPEERLRTLEAQYASALALYSADHPDVRRLRREIAALRESTGATGVTSSADALKEMESRLAQLRERYADDHPEVQRLTRTIAALRSGEARDATGVAPRRPLPQSAQPPDNPAYIALQTQIESTKRELASLAALKDDLAAKQRSYYARLMQIPEIEREYRDLTRDYDNAQTRYREVKAKQMQAQVAVELERDRKAERFMLSEPTSFPERPVSPNRPQIVLIGFLAALFGGVGLGWARDTIDPSIKGPDELSRLARFPILTAIPYIETRNDKDRERRRLRSMIWVALALGLAFLAVIHLFRPLPELLDAVLRKIHFW